jgi:hypothetical protein
MIAWASRWLIWIAIRLAVTGACIFTIQSVLASEGFRTETRSLLIIAGCMIIAIRVWSSNPDTKEKETLLSDDDF